MLKDRQGIVEAVLKVPRRSRGIAAAVVLSAALGACGGARQTVVAEVGRNPVTASGVQHWISVRAAMDPAAIDSLGPSSHMPSKDWAVAFLLAAARTVGEASEQGVGVTAAEASRVLARVRYEQTYGQSTTEGARELAALLSSRAETQADRLWIVKLHLLATMIEQRQRVDAERRVTHSQIADYYAKHRQRFVMPERRDVAVIETFTRSKIDRAKQEIDSGRGFIEVMRRRNDEPDVGGLKVGLPRTPLRHQYEENYFLAKPHRPVGPLKAEIYYLFEVMRVTPARQETLVEVQDSIRRKLVALGRPSVVSSDRLALETKWRTMTRCRAGYSVPQCGGPLD
jgi:hypothetical protein